MYTENEKADRFNSQSGSKTFNMVLTAMFAALIAVASWISVPLPFTPIPINLATLAVSLTGALLGYKYGTFSVLVYLLLGAVGVPVFAGSPIGTLALSSGVPTISSLPDCVPVAVGACGILFLVCVDVYRRHGICQMMADETIVVVVVDCFNLRVADGIWSRIVRLADTSGADCVGHLGEPGAALAIAVAARPLHAQPSELVVQEEPVPPAERGILHIGHAVGPVVPVLGGGACRAVLGQDLHNHSTSVVITVFVGKHCPGA